MQLCYDQGGPRDLFFVRIQPASDCPFCQLRPSPEQKMLTLWIILSCNLVFRGQKSVPFCFLYVISSVNQ
jgi:hypothetical protein